MDSRIGPAGWLLVITNAADLVNDFREKGNLVYRRGVRPGPHIGDFTNLKDHHERRQNLQEHGAEIEVVSPSFAVAGMSALGT